MASSDVSSALSTTIGLITALVDAKGQLALDTVEGNSITTDQANIQSAVSALVANLVSVWGLTTPQAQGLLQRLPQNATGEILTAIVNSAAALQAL